MIKISIIGAGGFTGLELLRLLAHRNDVQVTSITSNEFAGKNLGEIAGDLAASPLASLNFLPHPKEPSYLPEFDLAFTATPDEASLYHIPKFLKAGKKVIDIAGAYRLKTATEFENFYGIEHTDSENLKHAVFGLPELNRKAIKEASLVANPGCYPTSVLIPFLALQPLLNQFSPVVIIDAKSGTSGAGGRKEKDSLGFSTVYENFRSYKTEKHQHMPEIRQVLNSIAEQKFKVRFTPHLLPMFRGILSTIYLTEVSNLSLESVQKVCRDFASREPFVRFLDSCNQIELKNVQHTNRVDFAVLHDVETGHFVIQSAIDNLLKGAAGQAIQNMNLMIGAEETRGLT
ncbi:MAG: N-acetyl-gamma-glutamyl-phosphate reductase [Leptospiraceae bacterium]|nr:N-acetyl-gamma-glutamyl-phosphate reductase [Leptospiraceae bacterium]